MIKFLKLFKRSLIWKYIVLFLIKPIFDFFWTYIINFEAKFLYFKWNKNKKNFFDLNDANHLIVEDNKDIESLANELSNFCDEDVLQKSKNKMLSEEDCYTNHLFDLLPRDLKEKVVKFASSDLIVNTATQYLGVFPILSRIYLYHNIPRSHETIKAQRWHKDGMSYKGLDFFISITDIDIENGPFSFVTRKNKLGAFEKIDKVDENAKPGGRGKVSDLEFTKIFEDHEIETVLGKKGTCIIVDSYNCYHKGGHCKTKDRVMLRIAFDTIDSSVIYYDEEKYKSDTIFYYNKKKISEVESDFTKYLMFRRSKFIKKFDIAPKMLKLYDFLDYKH